MNYKIHLSPPLPPRADSVLPILSPQVRDLPVPGGASGSTRGPEVLFTLSPGWRPEGELRPAPGLSSPELCSPHQVAVSPKPWGSGQSGIPIRRGPLRAPGSSGPARPALQSSAGVPPKLPPAGWGSTRSPPPPPPRPGPLSPPQPRAVVASTSQTALRPPGGHSDPWRSRQDQGRGEEKPVPQCGAWCRLG